MNTVIEARGLTKVFESKNGNVTAVRDLDLIVCEGEILGFLGPNGAGKTTTVRMLAGMIAPTSGEALVRTSEGMTRAGEDGGKVHGEIGFLTEMPGFYERLTAYENLMFFANFYPGIQPGIQIEKYLKMMGLWERKDHKVGTFSKGMKQKLSLARAILHEPRVLFLDEPTSGLDPEARMEVRDLIRGLRDEKRTVFLCTHNLEEAEMLCDRIGVFKTELVAMDTPANLRRGLFSRQMVLTLEKADDRVFDSLKKSPLVKTLAREDGQTLAVELADFDKGRADFLKTAVDAGARVLSYAEREHSLEEIYMTLLNEEEKNPAAGRKNAKQ